VCHHLFSRAFATFHVYLCRSLSLSLSLFICMCECVNACVRVYTQWVLHIPVYTVYRLFAYAFIALHLHSSLLLCHHFAFLPKPLRVSSLCMSMKVSSHIYSSHLVCLFKSRFMSISVSFHTSTRGDRLLSVQFPTCSSKQSFQQSY